MGPIAKGVIHDVATQGHIERIFSGRAIYADNLALRLGIASMLRRAGRFAGLLPVDRVALIDAVAGRAIAAANL